MAESLVANPQVMSFSMAGLNESRHPLFKSRKGPTVRTLCYAAFLGIAAAAVMGETTFMEAQEATFLRVGKAPPDEFYTGLGNDYIPLGEQDPDQEGQPKVNQDYVWSLATDGTNIWFGTGGNAAAQADGLVALAAGQQPQPEEFRSPILDIPYRVWEFGQSQYPGIRRLYRTILGDFRPPRVYHYNAETNELVDRTPNDRNLESTLGLRAGGVHNGVALLCGQAFNGIGIYVYAFDAESGDYLGSTLLRQYSQIRRFIVANGQLYTGVLNTLTYRSRGSVLRWTGSRSNPFSFQVVGNLDNDVAYLAFYNNRLFAGTWRSISLLGTVLGSTTNPPPCGIWMSPNVPSGGLTASSASRWTKVWDPTFYEIEPGAVGGYAMGAMEAFGDSLYFGTLHFPGQGVNAFQQTYGTAPPSPTSNAERTPIIVRARNWGTQTPPIVTLEYGNTNLPKYNSTSGGWGSALNATGAAALRGQAGFGNTYNRYIWSSSVFNGKLYFGTFDISALIAAGIYVDDPLANPIGIGCDLWSFSNVGQAAVRQNRNGCGNPTNHGIRNMVSTPYGLFLGTANSQNLLTDPMDNLQEGGWELLKLLTPLSTGASEDTDTLGGDGAAEALNFFAID